MNGQRGYSGRRVFMGKPGIYARKEISAHTEVQIPGLQTVVCVFILFLDTLLILSWGLILPTVIVYATSMIAIVILMPVLTSSLFFGFRKTFDWLKIFPRVLKVILFPVQILRFVISYTLSVVHKVATKTKNFTEEDLEAFQEDCLRTDEFLSVFPTFVETHWTTISIVATMIVFTVTVLIFIFAHNAWHDICVSLPHLDLPIPILGGHSWPITGVFLACVGIIGFAFRPGRYSLGMTAFGGIVTAILQYFRPMTVKMTYGWTLPLYGIWASLCFAFIVGTGTLFPRFYVRDILEYSDYPEQRAPDPLENSLASEDRSGRGGQEGY